MEFLSILLSSLLFIGSPPGLVLDQVAENAIRSRLAGVETVAVRVDNASAFQLLQGKVDSLRVSLRGALIMPDLRIAIAELESDPIDLDVGALQRGQVVLDQPLQAGVRLVLTAADLNQFLNSPAFLERLSNIQINLDNAAQSREVQRYRLSHPNATFLADDRLQLKVDLLDQVLNETIQIEVKTGLNFVNGHRLTLVEPELLVNGSPAPKQLLDAALANLGEQLSLRRLEASGITARVLNLQVDTEDLELALWVQVDPRFTRTAQAN